MATRDSPCRFLVDRQRLTNSPCRTRISRFQGNAAPALCSKGRRPQAEDRHDSKMHHPTTVTSHDPGEITESFCRYRSSPFSRFLDPLRPLIRIRRVIRRPSRWPPCFALDWKSRPTFKRPGCRFSTLLTLHTPSSPLSLLFDASCRLSTDRSL